MARSDDDRLRDILDAGRQIIAIVDGGQEMFGHQVIRQLATERLLEIIGEAARALSEEFRARYPEVPWADIVGLRVLLAHHYHRIDPAQVWVVASTSVPALVAVLADGEE